VAANAAGFLGALVRATEENCGTTGQWSARWMDGNRADLYPGGTNPTLKALWHQPATGHILAKLAG